MKVIKEGYEPWDKEMIVEARKTAEVLATLKEVKGELEVRSEPSRAKVYLDGKEVGETPLILPGMRLGQHQVRVVKEGYDPYEERVEVTGAERKTVHVPLEIKMGGLVVHTEPSMAGVYIDGRSVGRSPYEGKGLPPKSYKVRVAKQGYEAWERDVTVEAGKKTEVLAKLKFRKNVIRPFGKWAIIGNTKIHRGSNFSLRFWILERMAMQ